MSRDNRYKTFNVWSVDN